MQWDSTQFHYNRSTGEYTGYHFEFLDSLNTSYSQLLPHTLDDTRPLYLTNKVDCDIWFCNKHVVRALEIKFRVPPPEIITVNNQHKAPYHKSVRDHLSRDSPKWIILDDQYTDDHESALVNPVQAVTSIKQVYFNMYQSDLVRIEPDESRRRDLLVLGSMVKDLVPEHLLPLV